MNRDINILIISNKYDYTSDYVCAELNKRGCSYLRLNRDEFMLYKILLDPILAKMQVIDLSGNEYNIVESSLNSVYYRAPTFLRDNYQPQLTPEEQLYRNQWTAFVRNLTIYEEVRWMNNPVFTYKAENKLLQLKVATRIGFNCPQTLIANYYDNQLNDFKGDELVVKSIDTALLKIGDKEAFVYTNVINKHDAQNNKYSISPVLFQQYITPKIDIRVTVVNETVYSVKILSSGDGIEGDWRMRKYRLDYIPFNLPCNISLMCKEIVRELGLSFGAIDLIYSKGKYYFVEVNPTGEWAWLVDTAKQETQVAICDYLEGAKYVEGA